ncbi:hypothetical protein CF640_36980 [Burkholderia pseudomallei]|nr:hypothetical protein CF640_36980 [Burkholderia pseudomallei]
MLGGVLLLGACAVAELLVWIRLVLPLLLPFCMSPLFLSVGDRSIMRVYAFGRVTIVVALSLFVLVSLTNLVLVTGFVG